MWPPLARGADFLKIMSDNNEEPNDPEALEQFLRQLMRLSNESPETSAQTATLRALSSQLWRKLFLIPLLSVIRHGGFLTNDLVEVSGSLRGSMKHIRVNGARGINLTKPEFLVLYVLAAHSRTLAGLTTPRKTEIEAEVYLSAKDIVSVLETWAREDPALSWNTSSEAVHSAIWKLRGRLAEAGLNQNLIETRSREEGGGYRLSTASFNVDIQLR